MSKKQKEQQILLESQTLPSENELEQSILGSILVDNSVFPVISRDFSENLFYETKNKLIAEAIMHLYKGNIPIDILTISQQLTKTNNITDAGGAFYISTLTNKALSSANIEYHLKILQQKCLERSLIYICNKSLVSILTYKDDVFDIYSNIQKELEDSLRDMLKYEVKTITDIHYDILERNINVIQKGIKSGIPTGLNLVDNMTNGWQKSDLIIIAGRPSMGKTAAAVSLIIYPVLEQKIPIAIFSLEMSNFQIGSRIQSFISGVNVSKIIKGQLNMDEVRHITDVCNPLEKAPLYIDDTPNISLLELKAKARKLVKDKGVQMIVIDYLQLMRSGLDIQNREQEIATISRGLKSLAKELNIPVIALSQLSRLVEARSDKKPMLSDLRESGQIEQDADMVIFCYRPEYYGIENYEIGNQTFNSNGLMMLLVSKHRNGELGEVPLKFIHEQAKIDNYILENNYNVEQSYTDNNYKQNDNNSNTNPILVPQLESGKLNNNNEFLTNNLPF